MPKGKTIVLSGSPAYGFWSDSIRTKPNQELEFRMGPVSGTYGFTKDWDSYFSLSTNMLGRFTILQAAVYRVHFKAKLYASVANPFGTWVECRLKIARGENELFVVGESFVRIDGKHSVGLIEFVGEMELRKNDRIFITLTSESEVASDENARMHVQLVGALPSKKSKRKGVPKKK